MEAARHQEEDERVLSSSVFAVQPWMDIPEMGWCSVVVTDGGLRACRSTGQRCSPNGMGSTERICPALSHLHGSSG